MNRASDSDALAERLDRLLSPQGDLATDDPALNVALELARAPRPRLDRATAARIEAQVLARADLLHGQRHANPRRRTLRVARWAAAACLMIVLAVMVARFSAESSAPPRDSARVFPPVGLDTTVMIPQDVLNDSPAPIVRESASTTLIIAPPGP